MQACASTAEEAMEEIIPTIMSALSMNEAGDEIMETRIDDTASPSNHRGRPRQQQENIGSTETQLQTTKSSEFCGTAEGVDEIIPAIMNALSFQQTTEEIPLSRTRSTGTATSRRRRPRAYSEDIPRTSSVGISASRRRNQQQRQMDANDTASILENLESSSRGTKETRKSTTKGLAEESKPSIVDSRSFSERVLRRINSDKAQIIPSIINTLSFQTTEEASNGDTSEITPNQFAKTSERSHTTITEEGSIMRGFREEVKINGPPSTKRNSSFRRTSTNEASSEQGFCSIKEVFSMDDGETKAMQNDAALGSSLSNVYPIIRNVFSMNDVDTNSPVRSKGELLGYAEKARPDTLDEEQGSNLSERKTKPTQKIVVSRAYEVNEHYLESVFYVSISAILGSVFRVYMARIFGSDCQYSTATDFLVPFSSNICVTNDGRSEQTGGALFTDFPSNVFGSFLMGMITPPVNKQRARLPWLHRDHPLQRDEVFHASLGTGFCGCLTTFASWNTQMVVMLDGTYCELGSQVVTVLFGYVIGLMGASYGFQLGRDCGLWMYNFRHRNDDQEQASSPRDGANVDNIIRSQLSQDSDLLLGEGVELVDDDIVLEPDPSHLHKIPLFLTAVVILVAFVIGDKVNGIEFYKGMTLLWVLSPVGSLLRWKLSDLNKKKISKSMDWIPWGTLIANLLATLLSACMEGLINRYFGGDNPSSTNQWVVGMLFALKTGVAGSLSTVSTMVKESTHLTEDHPGLAHGHYYSMLTCIPCCLLGLAVYSATIRF